MQEALGPRLLIYWFDSEFIGFVCADYRKIIIFQVFKYFQEN